MILALDHPNCPDLFRRRIADSDPPVTNRGGKSHLPSYLSIDYVTGVFPVQFVESVLSWLVGCFDVGDKYQMLPGLNCYRFRVELGAGLNVMWSPDRSDAYFSVSGAWCQSVQIDQLIGLMFNLEKHCQVRGTRVDIAEDLFCNEIKPSELASWAEAGYLWRGVRYRYIKSSARIKEPTSIDRSKYRPEIAAYIPESWQSGGIVHGETFEAGRKGRDGSGRFIRVYDKGAEQGIPVNWVRFECQYSGDAARDIYESVTRECRTDGIYRDYRLAGWLAGSMDFLYPSARSNGSGRVRVEKWADFVEGKNPVTVSTRSDHTPKRFNIDQFIHQYGRKLYIAFRAEGLSVSNLLSRCIEHGRQKIDSTGELVSWRDLSDVVVNSLAPLSAYYRHRIAGFAADDVLSGVVSGVMGAMLSLDELREMFFSADPDTGELILT